MPILSQIIIWLGYYKYGLVIPIVFIDGPIIMVISEFFLDADVIIFEIDDFIKRALKVFSEHPAVRGLTVYLKVLPPLNFLSG